jgi:hypothetical protein
MGPLTGKRRAETLQRLDHTVEAGEIRLRFDGGFSKNPRKTDGQARRARELSPAAMSDRRLSVLSLSARIPKSAFS